MDAIATGCPYDCGGSCPIVAYREEGRIVRLGPEEGPDSPKRPTLRPCAKGLAQLQRVYHPERLLHPMKRVGERGEGSFRRISWDEALDEVAGELRRVRDVYGPAAILNLRGAGNVDGLLHRTTALPHRFFNLLGGQTAARGAISYEAAVVAGRSSFGLVPSPPEPESLLQSKLVIVWGSNPAETVFGTDTNYYLALAKEHGTKFVFVDPRFTDSAASLADRWIPIRPCTDTAMLVAMAFVLIQENLYDAEYVRRYTHGFEQFRAYCMGAEDGVPKTPFWAERICGVPAGVIASLAREYAACRPADLKGGWSPGRTAYGEQFHRACIALSAMAGNVGVPGGGPGCWVVQDFAATLGVSGLPPLQNPTGKSVPAWRWADAVLEGTAGGYPSDIKMIYVVGGNRLSQCGDVRKGMEALRKVESVVVHEQFITPLARFADLLLPASTHFEREDVQVPHCQGHYLIYNRRVIDPVGESRSDLEIFTALAERLGMAEFNRKTDEEWLREFLSRAPVDLDTLRTQGVYRYDPPRPPSPLEQFVSDPERHPLPTPSGKIEIFSQALARLEDPRLPAVPQYLEDPDGPHPSAAGRFPILLVTTHNRRSVHSAFFHIPWARELPSDGLWLSSADAEARGIRDGDRVLVHNDLGSTVVVARVTERIMPGVASLNQGAWYSPDEQGRDRAGCANVLCPDTISPAEAAATNGILVEVSRLED